MPKKASPVRRHPDLRPVHPGEMLREDILPALGISAADLARSLDISAAVLRGIVSEKKPVTPEIAVRLAKAFRPSAEFWLRLQASYDLWHASRTVDTSTIPKLQAAK